MNQKGIRVRNKSETQVHHAPDMQYLVLQVACESLIIPWDFCFGYQHIWLKALQCNTQCSQACLQTWSLQGDCVPRLLCHHARHIKHAV